MDISHRHFGVHSPKQLLNPTTTLITNALVMTVSYLRTVLEGMLPVNSDSFPNVYSTLHNKNTVRAITG